MKVIFKNNSKEGAKSWRLLKLEKAIAYREAGQYPLSNDKLDKIIEELKKIMVNKGKYINWQKESFMNTIKTIQDYKEFLSNNRE